MAYMVHYIIILLTMPELVLPDSTYYQIYHPQTALYNYKFIPPTRACLYVYILRGNNDSSVQQTIALHTKT